MKRICTTLVVMGVALVAATAAFATNTPPQKITICHVAGLASDPANYITLELPPQAVYGNGGHFNENGTPQAGHEQDSFGACNPPPPFDQCPDLEGNQPEGTDCNPPPNPCPNGDMNGEEEGCETVVVPPTPPCPDGGEHNAGKDGQVPGSGNTNDDCDRSVTPPVVVTPPATTPTPPATPVPPVVTPETPEAPVTKPDKPKKEKEEKPVAEPKPDAPVATTEVKPATATAKETLPFTGVPAGLYALLGIVLTGAGALLRRFN